MAAANYSPSSDVLAYLLFSSALLLLLSSGPPTCHCASDQDPTRTGADARTHHAVDVRTLLSRDDVCSPSKGSDHTAGVMMKVVHRHGPCSPSHGGRRGPSDSKPTAAQALLLDESRAESLRRVTKARGGRPGPGESLAAAIPTRSGVALGTANFVVTVGLGTPKRELSLLIDTANVLNWIQCQPCSGRCYPQEEPVFDPAGSSSYRNISCISSECLAMESATGRPTICNAHNCYYDIDYLTVEGRATYHSSGFYARETLSLTSADVFPDFHFGCGVFNQLVGKTAGMLGLGRGMASLASQLSGKYGAVFSYCLPSSPSTIGYLTLGASAATTSGVKFTPMLSNSRSPSSYFLDLIGITVAGQQISIPASVFQRAGTLIDSSTHITRLPPDAYAALRSAFRQHMSGYPAAPSRWMMDTCYDFTGHNRVLLPKVALLFRDGVTLDVHVSGLMYGPSEAQMCLAFVANPEPTDVAIIGNWQQKTHKVVYDVAGELIGFGPGGCS